MSADEVSAIIMETARRVPLGGTIRIKGSEAVSAYNFAVRCAVIVARANAGQDVYNLICNQPPRCPHEHVTTADGLETCDDCKATRTKLSNWATATPKDASDV